MKNRISIKISLALLILLSACYKKPAGLTNPEPQELYQEIIAFYKFIQYKDLDSFADKMEIQGHFEDQDHYYIFLDTILPAMWERKFERNRIIDFQILSIEMNEDETQAWVQIWILSDDTLPFGKVMTYKHRWYFKHFHWYPAEIKAKKATLWEKYR